MVELYEERVVKWEQQGKNIEVRISGDRIEISSDDGQSFKADFEVWSTFSSILGSSKVSRKPSRKKPSQEKPDGTHQNQGQPWSAELDEQLKLMWESGETTRNLSAYFGRTTGGIASRLVKLGIVESRDEARSRKAPQ
jgi:hypothetical protein